METILLAFLMHLRGEITRKDFLSLIEEKKRSDHSIAANPIFRDLESTVRNIGYFDNLTHHIDEFNDEEVSHD